MKILVVQPGKKPKAREINGSLESMQSVVGGYIQAIYPFEEPIALVCNEEGKINGFHANRALVSKDGDVLDIICGTFFLCEAPPQEAKFTSLNDDEIKHYTDMFRGAVVVV